MPKKSGFSHALAAVVSLLLGAILTGYLARWFPAIVDPIERWAAAVQAWAEARVGVALSPDLFVPLFVASLIAFVWGLLYHMLRHGSD